MLPELLLAPALVGAASLTARHRHEHAAGIVSALPAVVGPALLIVALEHGPDFAARAASATLLGVAALAAFAVTYAHAARHAGWPGALAAAWAAAAAVVSFSSAVPAVALVGALVACASLAAAVTALPVRPGAERVGAVGRAWPRMAAAAALVALLAAAGDRFGAFVAGILAALPILASVLVVATHRDAGPVAAIAFIGGMLAGMTGFVAFCAAIAFLVVPLGIGAAFAVATAAALLTQALAYSGWRSSLAWWISRWRTVSRPTGSGPPAR